MAHSTSLASILESVFPDCWQEILACAWYTITGQNYIIYVNSGVKKQLYQMESNYLPNCPCLLFPFPTRLPVLLVT